VVHVTSLVWLGADIAADTVYGTAEPGTWVEVSVHGPEWAQRLVQADGSGDWEADFSVPGTEDFEQDILDLDQGYHGRAIQFEGGNPDDGTLAYWHTPEYTIMAHPGGEGISSHGWAPDVTVTMYIDDNDNPSDNWLFEGTGTTSPDGDIWFDGGNWGYPSLDLEPGMYVIATDGVTVETLYVEAISVDSFDIGAGMVNGTAPPGRDVYVGVNSGDFWMIVTSDEDGYWSADFGAGTFTSVDDIHAIVWDGDGDATQANYEFP